MSAAQNQHRTARLATVQHIYLGIATCSFDFGKIVAQLFDRSHARSLAYRFFHMHATKIRCYGDHNQHTQRQQDECRLFSSLHHSHPFTLTPASAHAG